MTPTPVSRDSSANETRVQIERLLAGEMDALAIRRGVVVQADEKPTIVFPGAFNPLHEGHQRMSELACSLLGARTAFEISFRNVDKTEVDVREILTRVRQFPDEQLVWLTTADTFVKKSKIFPGATFVVGADTLLRVARPKYYNHDIGARDQAIRELRTQGNRFLVFGRHFRGQFCLLENVEIPLTLRELCTGISEATFRVDVSSTSLRETGASPP